MRIGLLTTSFPRFEDDIAGCFVLGFARALHACGHSVHVLAPEPEAPHALPDLDPIRLDWVPYLRPRALERTFYGAGVPDNLRQHPTAWLGLAPFTLALGHRSRRLAPRWDAIVSHWALPCALVGGLVRADKPHMAVFHSADIHLLERLPFRHRIAARILRTATALVFVSDGLRARFEALLAEALHAEFRCRAHTTPMGVEVGSSSASRTELRARLDLHRPTALILSRLVPIKGTEIAIRALAGRDDAELVIAGEGPERERLTALAAQIRAPVRFLGAVGGQEKIDLLAAADLFLSPSVVLSSGRIEGTPHALLQALAAGLPVVAARAGGACEVIVHDDNGLLVEPGNVADLAAAVSDVINDDAKRTRLGRTARASAERYLWTTVGEDIDRWLTQPALTPRPLRPNRRA